MQTSILEFLKENKIASICFINNQAMPYCITCFYTFDEQKMLLVFKSSFGTSHDFLAMAETLVAGTILPDALDVLKIKGIQFSGKSIAKLDIDQFKLQSQYTKKYPLSLTMPGYIWAIQLETIKYTNNTLGFGNKSHWKRGEETP